MTRHRTERGTLWSLVLAAHPARVAAAVVVLALGATLSGRSGTEVLLVAATVLCGQVAVGWVHDVADAPRDAAVGRQDRPVALGWVDPGTVGFWTAVVVLVLVPLAIANGTVAGVAYLASVVAAWLDRVWFHRTVLSWLPMAVSFGLLPAFLSYGGLGGGIHGAPPTLLVTGLAALLGVCDHVLTRLPRLVQDRETGLRHLPLRVALRTGAPRLLWVTVGATVVVAAALVVALTTVGLRQ